jgi:hypothetical protein
MRLATTSVVQGAVIVVVLIAAIVVAVVNPSAASSKESVKATRTLGTEICFGFGQAPVSQYHETAKTLPTVVSEAQVLSSSAAWQTVGDALKELTTLGPTAGWTSSQLAVASLDLRGLHVACVPHLRSTPR